MTFTRMPPRRGEMERSRIEVCLAFVLEKTERINRQAAMKKFSMTACVLSGNLKAENQIQGVSQMNNIRNSAEEIALTKIVYR